MPYVNYNFDNFDRAMSHLKNGQTNRACKELKTELNKFFKGSTCKEVIFTKNTDKLFFGMTTYCEMTTGQVTEAIFGDQPVRIQKYSIEIDSKLLDMGLQIRELTAVLLHEVGHVVNDSMPIEEVRRGMDKYMAEYESNLDIKKAEDLVPFFRFAIRDTIRKTTSLFNRNDEEILADEFVFRCGYGAELESAFRKIKANALSINSNMTNKFITLQWALQIYTNIGVHRLGAIKTLNRVKELSGSEYEKKEADQVITALKGKTPVYESADVVHEDSKRTLAAKLRRKGLRSMEEDLYEYQMRSRNVEDENEAIVLMRQINARMSTLDSYIYDSANLDKRDVARWQDLYDRYAVLRNELSKKTVYNNKSYGLWLDYNYANNVSQSGDAFYH